MTDNWDALKEARELAEHVYDEAIELDTKTYWKGISQVEKAYREATARAREARKEAIARAEKDMPAAPTPPIDYPIIKRLGGTGIKLRVTERATGKLVHYGVQLNNTTLEIEALPNLLVEIEEGKRNASRT